MYQVYKNNRVKPNHSATKTNLNVLGVNRSTS